MRHILFTIILFSASLAFAQTSREVINFNADWQFSLGDKPEASKKEFNDASWRTLTVPHDWSIEQGYQKPLAIKDKNSAKKMVSANQNNLPTGISALRVNEFRKTASSTGFVEGGVAWYRKAFNLTQNDKNKVISIEFGGVYTRSKVWINGHYLGFQPNGYISFSYDLTKHLNFDGDNVIAVRVDHTNYVDARWYIGSGIYQNVRLVKKNPIHLAQWGVHVRTPEVSKKKATVLIESEILNTLKADKDLTLKIEILNAKNKRVAKYKEKVSAKNKTLQLANITVKKPKLWNLNAPDLYKAKVSLWDGKKEIDNDEVTFGIRTFEFSANKGFILNGKSVKLKGVNLHSDAGAVGVAVPDDVWKRRIQELQKVGCNAIRLAHNPYSSEFLDLCDELGVFVMDEFFDEWTNDKGKHTTKLGANDAPDSFTGGYSSYFKNYAKQDLQSVIKRDRNHPSVMMWSIGNEIEWTFPYYSKTYQKVNGKVKYYEYIPEYDSTVIRKAFDETKPEVDSMVVWAKRLTAWTKEMDKTRPVTLGSVMPSVAMVSGVGQTLDVLGFNYRAVEYDGAHKEYPNLRILGSENNGTWEEWNAVNTRDFVAGIFIWTGIAYQGEAGPFPRKGLNLSLFDFACFKTPRGHFYECLWKDEPKVYIGTATSEVSEFKYKKDGTWDVQLRTDWLRRWTWYDIDDTWNYNSGDSIVVQGYTNCEEAELFLNGKSLGKQVWAENDDRIMKWMVPYQAGELKVVGYNEGEKVDEYILASAGKTSEIKLTADRKTMSANGTDVVHVEVELVDENGVRVPNNDIDVKFEVEGPATIIGVDNGSEYNVQDPKADHIITKMGKALLLVQSNETAGTIKIKATCKNIKSNEITVHLK